MADIENTLPNYRFIHLDRKFRKGGGVAALVRDGLNVRHDICEYRSMECLDLHISSRSTSFQLVILYRQWPTKKDKLTLPMFFEEFYTLSEPLLPPELVIYC